MCKVILFVLMTALACTAVAQPKVAAQPAKESAPAADPRLDAARQQVLDSLNDPESARFKPLYVGADGETVCGAVNAKNRMGGYAGFKRFMLDADGNLFFEDRGPSFPGLIDMACRR
jgi:hypothetical protein